MKVLLISLLMFINTSFKSQGALPSGFKESIVKITLGINDKLLEIPEIKTTLNNLSTLSESLSTKTNKKRSTAKWLKNNQHILFSHNPSFSFIDLLFSKSTKVIWQKEPEICVVGKGDIYFGLAKSETNSNLAGFFNYNSATGEFIPIHRLIMSQNSLGEKKYADNTTTILPLNYARKYPRIKQHANLKEEHGLWSNKSLGHWGYMGAGIIKDPVNNRKQSGTWINLNKKSVFILNTVF